MKKKIQDDIKFKNKILRNNIIKHIYNFKRHMYPSVNCSNIYSRQDMEAT